MREGTQPGDGLKWLALIAGMVLAFPIVIVMIAEASFLLATMFTLGFLAWVGIRTGLLTANERAADETADPERDPLTVLQERYAAGEISESEFERRLERILESDELVRGETEQRTQQSPQRASEEPSIADLERELDTER